MNYHTGRALEARAIELLEKGDTAEQVMRRLEIPKKTLYRWVRKHGLSWKLVNLPDIQFIPSTRHHTPGSIKLSRMPEGVDHAYTDGFNPEYTAKSKRKVLRERARRAERLRAPLRKNTPEATASQTEAKKKRRVDWIRRQHEEYQRNAVWIRAHRNEEIREDANQNGAHAV